MKCWIAIAVLTLALLASLVFAGFMLFHAGTMKTESRHFQARADLFEGLSVRNCLRIDALESAAKKRGWVSDRASDNTAFIPQDATYTEDQIAETLIVKIMPARPFSKGFGSFFHFDDQGCLLR